MDTEEGVANGLVTDQCVTRRVETRNTCFGTLFS